MKQRNLWAVLCFAAAAVLLYEAVRQRNGN